MLPLVTDVEVRREQARQLLVSLQPDREADGTYTAVPNGFWGPRVFGGQVIAQAVVAAMHGADSTDPPHSLHAYFLRPVTAEEPVRMSVQNIRTGRSFSTYELRMTQNDQIKYLMTCQFHGDEPGEDYQPQMPDVPGPDELTDPWPRGPIECRVLEPTERREDGTYEWTRRVWFRLFAELPDDPLITAGVAAYVSDLTGNSFRPLSLDQWRGYTDASLDHALWFHRPIRLDEWAFYDVNCAVNHGGRSLIRGSLYDAAGVLCLSMSQELLIRPLENTGDRRDAAFRTDG